MTIETKLKVVAAKAEKCKKNEYEEKIIMERQINIVYKLFISGKKKKSLLVAEVEHKVYDYMACNRMSQ